jgi:membrane-associated protease RseP (regulator of RpoE activity)
LLTLKMKPQEMPTESFYQLPVIKRNIIMLGGPVMNLLLGVLLTVIALTGFGIYQSSLKIEAVSVCLDNTSVQCPVSEQTPAHVAGLKPGDEVVSVAGNKATDWAQIRDLLTATPTAEFEILRDGEVIKVTLTAVIQQRPQFDSLGNPILDESGEIVSAPQPFLGVFWLLRESLFHWFSRLRPRGQQLLKLEL